MVVRLDAVIVGGGVVGLYTALDLSMRGFKVALIERSYVGSGTSGRMHGLLHSGARYVVRDPAAALECMQENDVISMVAPHAVENTGGYFVALDGDDVEYQEEFLRSLRRVGIWHRVLDPGEALKEEPFLSPRARLVVEVPDKVVYAGDMLASIALTAFSEGALVLEQAELYGIEISGGLVESAIVMDRSSGEVRRLRTQALVNAAGPWAGRVAGMAGVELEVMPTAGVMAVYPRRLTRRVINRLRPPSDGDIVVPYHGVSVAGTTAKVIEDPDSVSIEDEDLEILSSEASQMIPALSGMRISRSYYSVRPLIKTESSKPSREATRDFKIYTHSKPSNMVSAIGGKFTTGRLVAEKLSDATSELLGSSKSSITKDKRLLGNDFEELVEALRSSESSWIVERLRAHSSTLDWERLRGAVLSISVSLISIESRKILGWYR